VLDWQRNPGDYDSSLERDHPQYVDATMPRSLRFRFNRDPRNSIVMGSLGRRNRAWAASAATRARSSNSSLAALPMAKWAFVASQLSDAGGYGRGGDAGPRSAEPEEDPADVGDVTPPSFPVHAIVDKVTVNTLAIRTLRIIVMAFPGTATLASTGENILPRGVCVTPG
jgi:hypothetical protein